MLLGSRCPAQPSEVLASPTEFFSSRQLWPPPSGTADSDLPAVQELFELFLYIALDKWLGRLAEEAGKQVPAAAAAARAVQEMSRCHKLPSSSASQPLPAQEQDASTRDIHPAALLQHLPGGPFAVKSVLLAKHRARQMKLQAELARICCAPRMGQVPTSAAAPSACLLDEA